MINIIVKHPDLSVTRIIPNAKKYSDATASRCKALQAFIQQGLSWFFCESENLPDKKALESRAQWYWDGDQVKVDDQWEFVLMPTAIIKKKHIARLNNIIDEAIADPDETRIALRTLREREKCASWDEKQWYDQALINLDDRVAKGELDKPVIRQKLQAKVNELSR